MFARILLTGCRRQGIVVAYGGVSVKYCVVERAPATTGDNWIISLHVGCMMGGRGGRTYHDAGRHDVMSWRSAEQRWFRARRDATGTSEGPQRHVTSSCRRPTQGVYCRLAGLDTAAVMYNDRTATNTCRPDRKLTQRHSASRDAGPHTAYVHSTIRRK